MNEPVSIPVLLEQSEMRAIVAALSVLASSDKAAQSAAAKLTRLLKTRGA